MLLPYPERRGLGCAALPVTVALSIFLGLGVAEVATDMVAGVVVAAVDVAGEAVALRGLVMVLGHRRDEHGEWGLWNTVDLRFGVGWEQGCRWESVWLQVMIVLSLEEDIEEGPLRCW